MVWKWGLGSNQILLAPESPSPVLCCSTLVRPTSVSLHLGPSAIRRFLPFEYPVYFPWPVHKSTACTKVDTGFHTQFVVR